MYKRSTFKRSQKLGAKSVVVGDALSRKGGAKHSDFAKNLERSVSGAVFCKRRQNIQNLQRILSSQQHSA